MLVERVSHIGAVMVLFVSSGEAHLRPSARRSARAVFYALQFFFPNLSYSRRFLPRNRHEIDRPGSTDRDGRRHIDVAPDRIRVRADGMSTLSEPFSGLLVDASHGHGKRGGQHETPCFISTKVDSGDDVDIVIGKAVAGIPAHMKERILKAGCIPAGEELFGIGRIALSA
jgi:hypothetical protein